MCFVSLQDLCVYLLFKKLLNVNKCEEMCLQRTSLVTVTFLYYVCWLDPRVTLQNICKTLHLANACEGVVLWRNEDVGSAHFLFRAPKYALLISRAKTCVSTLSRISSREKFILTKRRQRQNFK